MNFRTLLAALSLTLGACGTPNISNDFKIDKTAATGVATGTITYDAGKAAYRLHAHNSATGEKIKIEYGQAQWLPGGDKPDRALGKQGSSFAVELPAGNYVIDAWQVSQGMANVWSTAPTGIQFEVRPHEAIYLGNFHFHATSRVIRALSGATVTLSDQSARDLPIIREHFAALAAVPLTQTLATDAKLENVGGESNGRITTTIFIPAR